MIGKRSRESEQLLNTIERQVDRIHTALIVRDPGTTLSVDAYEGLRRQVVASASARLQHLAQLAEFDVALRRGTSVEDLVALVDQWLRQAGCDRVEDPSVQGAWETDANGQAVEVERAAYVDRVTGRVVRQGRLRLKPASAQSIEAETHGPASEDAEPEPTATDDGEREHASVAKAGQTRHPVEESEDNKGEL